MNPSTCELGCHHGIRVVILIFPAWALRHTGAELLSRGLLSCGAGPGFERMKVAVCVGPDLYAAVESHKEGVLHG